MIGGWTAVEEEEEVSFYQLSSVKTRSYRYEPDQPLRAGQSLKVLMRYIFRFRLIGRADVIDHCRIYSHEDKTIKISQVWRAASRQASTLLHARLPKQQWGEERRPAGNLLALTRSWRCSVVLSRVQETCSVQTSTKIVEKNVEKLTANKRKKVSRPVARLEMVCKISVRFWCQGRTDGKVKRLWLFNARESMVDSWGGRRTNHKNKKDDK